MTAFSNIHRANMAPPQPLSPEEAVPDDLLRLLAYGDAEAMAEITGSMQIAEMAGELLAYRLRDRARKERHDKERAHYVTAKRAARAAR